ncbi:hypothetical protein AJ80_03261 [Polytolypa hystricis UAMH7299]|uniref:BBC1/AIM3 cysteine proteinase-fold domain-containing protein n=1 Tax=Polytolypa hystricis (strain UAMH7299) TaxID=1447883 RepID=A0A2B7YJW4_POLH7|nr:hypothetical protein AJ80_03261 [Polytolypa hystricis UAMH7299]
MPSHKPTPKAPKTVPLDLSTRWFLNDPPTFPYPSLHTQSSYMISTYYSWKRTGTLWPPFGEDCTLIAAVQWEADMSVTKIRVRWSSKNVDRTVVGEQKYISPLSRNEELRNDEGVTILGDKALRLASTWYAPHILSFCRDRLGSTVGDGECWTLAALAIDAARPAARREGHEPPMRTLGRVHGQCLLEWDAGSGVPVHGILETAGVRAGDILELQDAEFVNASIEVHTAVVAGVDGSTCMNVLEQNGSVPKVVTEGRYDLREMEKGCVRIYRPVWESCIVRLGQVVDLKKVCERW